MTTQDRWVAAIKTARKNGARVLQNVGGCCRSCISADPVTKLRIAEGEEETAVLAWSYGGQGSRYWWSGGEMYTGNTGYSGERRETEVYFNHNNGAGNILAAAFREQGFEVEYEQDNDGRCVEVKLPQSEEAVA